MVLVDYYEDIDNFALTFDLKNNEWDDFDFLRDLFNSIYLFYNRESRCFFIKGKDIHRILEWGKTCNFEVQLTSFARSIVEQNRWYKDKDYRVIRNATFDSSVLTNGTKLFNFQKEAVALMLKVSSLYLADDAGLGKTIESIAVASDRFIKGQIDAIFLSVKNTLAYHWQTEFLMFSNVFKEEDIQIIENKNKTDIFHNYQDKKILIIPHHLTADIFLHYKKGKKLKKKSNFKWNKPLLDIRTEWQKESIQLIIDEADAFKHAKSVRTKALYTHIKFFKYKLFLSATPAINKFEHYYMQLHLLNKSIIPMCEDAFKLQIAREIGDKHNVYSITEYDEEKVNYYKKVFAPYFVKRLKKDVPEMKTIQRTKPIYLQMQTAHRKIYDKVSEETLLRIEQDIKNGVTFRQIQNNFSYLMLALDDPLLLQDRVVDTSFGSLLKKYKPEKNSKIPYLDSRLKNLIEEQGKKVIIFDLHPDVLEFLYKRYEKYDPLMIHGRLKDDMQERQLKQDRFNSLLSKYKLMLLSSQIGSAGLNLQKGSSNIIFYSIPFDIQLVRQGMDRTYRITSTEDSLVEFLVFNKTFDNIRLMRALNRIELNDDLLTKEISKGKLKQLLKGLV